MMVGGIDESGRGSIVGPLVVAGIKASEQDMEKWKIWGVKDSKLLSPKKRLSLYQRLTQYYSYKTIAVSPAQVDEAVMSVFRAKRLNYLEASIFAQIIDALANPSEPTVFYVDACDINATRFGNLVYNYQKIRPHQEVISRHHMDRDETVTGAASIIAKVERDMAIEKLKKEVGIDFGSGYPNSKTRVALSNFVKQTGAIPSWCRKSWRSWKRWLEPEAYERLANGNP